MRLVTTTEMREMDRATVEDYGLPSIVLMENAGRAVAKAAWDLLPEAGGRVLVLAGKGNNGGDGLVAARHLDAMGVEVGVFLFCRRDELSGDAATNAAYADRIGLTIVEDPDDEAVAGGLQLADVVIDALLGTGLRGEPRGRLAEVIELLDDCESPFVAVDLPSGVDADTGAVPGAAVEAYTTVTLGLAKTGLLQYPARGHCGELRVAGIGLPPGLADGLSPATYATDILDCQSFLPYRSPDAHKGDAGRLLVVAGAPGLTGAAALAATAAARAGAGLVTLGIPAPLQELMAVKLTEVMTVALPAGATGALSAAAAPDILDWQARVDAMAIGPGLSQEEGVAELVAALLEGLFVPVVVDADGLNALVERTDVLQDRPAPTVITPHPGELARLLGLPVSEIQADRLAVTRHAAEEFGAVVMLKGQGTVVAAPDGTAYINTTGNSGMASGGMGDVLTGVVGALLAGGVEVFPAAVAAAYLHGLAGDLAAATLGPRGILAGDVLERLPAAYGKVLETGEPAD